DAAFASVRSHNEAQLISGFPTCADHLGAQEEIDSLLAEDPLDLLSHVGVLAAHELRQAFDDRDTAPETTIGLCQFEANIAAAEHDHMFRQGAKLKCLCMSGR